MLLKSTVCPEIPSCYSSDGLTAWLFNAAHCHAGMFGLKHQQLKENTLLELFNLIKARKEPGLEYFLMIIHNIFYRTNSRFPSKIMKGVSQVLRLVEKYTRINFQTSTQEEFKENIKVRKQCATLAFLVYRFENTFYEGQHCPEVEEWRDICTGEKSENEFAEVKNCWLLPEL